MKRRRRSIKELERENLGENPEEKLWKKHYLRSRKRREKKGYSKLIFK